MRTFVPYEMVGIRERDLMGRRSDSIRWSREENQIGEPLCVVVDDSKYLVCGLVDVSCMSISVDVLKMRGRERACCISPDAGERDLGVWQSCAVGRFSMFFDDEL